MNNKRVLIYGSLAIPIAILGMPLYIYLPTYYVESIGLNTATVEITLFIARVLDVIADPFIGRALIDILVKKVLF